MRDVIAADDSLRIIRPKRDLREQDRMRRLALLIVCLLAVAPIVYATSGTELLAKVHARIQKIYLDQASFTLPDSFHNSGLDPETKANLVAQWADASATCHVQALYAYSEEHEIPLAEMVADDGSYTNKLHVDASWDHRLRACINRAWEAIGATPYPD